MTDWRRPALVRRYGVDISRSLGILAMLGACCATYCVPSDEKYARYIIAGASVPLLVAMLWTGLVGYEARRAASLDPTAIPEALATEWWRPPFVQRQGREIAKALGAAAILGFPSASAFWIDGGYRPYAVGLLYSLLLGGCFWTSTVGAEARRVAARLVAAQHAAAQAAQAAQGFVGLQQPPLAEGTNTTRNAVFAAAGCGVLLLCVAPVIVGFVVIAYVCVLLLIGLGHGSPPSWLP